jgi:hypothetical protein
MKHLRNIARDPRSTPRAPPKQVCDGFAKCVTGLFSIRSHSIVLYINDLGKCVTCVTCVTAFSSSF